MSQVAALLLMYIHDEEDAFWALDRLMTDDKYAMHGTWNSPELFAHYATCALCCTGFFVDGFPKFKRFSAHHDKVLKRYLPKVYKHFQVRIRHPVGRVELTHPVLSLYRSAALTQHCTR